MFVDRLKLIAFFLALSMVFTMFVSNSAFSGENPWDSDGGDNDPGDMSDTTVIVGGDDNIPPAMRSAANPGGGLDAVLFDIGFSLVKWCYGDLKTRKVVSLETKKYLSSHSEPRVR
jgi:hypothetical protein